jgi:predicted branched-subunit amino acid permease
VVCSVVVCGVPVSWADPSARAFIGTGGLDPEPFGCLPSPAVSPAVSDAGGRRRRGPGPARRQAVSVALSIVPFGVAFGVACVDAGLGLGHAIGFSALVFAGSSQFAAVGVLDDGGAAVSAILAGLLLNLRTVAFGAAIAPSLVGPRWWRALVSQVVIDESCAIGLGQPSEAERRRAFWEAGLACFVAWNVATIAGASVVASAGDAVERFGLDGTIPAAFLALLWPRLRDATQRIAAIAGAAIAVVLVPVAPAGLPVLAAAGAAAVVALLRRSPRRST